MQHRPSQPDERKKNIAKHKAKNRQALGIRRIQTKKCTVSRAPQWLGNKMHTDL